MEPEYVVATWRKMEPGTREGLLVFGALVLVILISVIWAVYFRKPRRHHRHQQHHHSSVAAHETEGLETEEGTLSAESRRRRRRRREHRPRNPTLAETGGLPPARTEGPPDALP